MSKRDNCARSIADSGVSVSSVIFLAILTARSTMLFPKLVTTITRCLASCKSGRGRNVSTLRQAIEYTIDRRCIERNEAGKMVL